LHQCGGRIFQPPANARYVTIKWDDGHESFSAHGDTKRVELVEEMTGTEFNALGTSLIVLGLAFVFSGLVFMLPSSRKRKENQ
jgi:hypothetical protein